MVDIPRDDELGKIMFPRPVTCEQLNERLSDIFHCMTGMPRAYMEIPLERLIDNPDPHVLTILYETVGFESRQPKDTAQEELVTKLWQVFIGARLVGCPIIFWRRPPRFEEHEEEGIKVYRAHCRVAVPGYPLAEWRAPWSKAFTSDNYKPYIGPQ